MSFRKLLVFVLVFSLATQPGGVRFGYAEDTKAAEVKIEKKTEVSDELAIELDESELDEYLFDPGSRKQKLEEAATVAAKETAKTGKISGALAGAIAAGVAAVTAAVGAAGLMIYNGVSNKDEIAKLWTSEEDSFFSRLGKTISILFKGAKEGEGYDQKNEEFDLPDEEAQASLFVQRQKDNPLMMKILSGKLETHHDTVEGTPEAPEEAERLAKEEKARKEEEERLKKEQEEKEKREREESERKKAEEEQKRKEEEERLRKEVEEKARKEAEEEQKRKAEEERQALETAKVYAKTNLTELTNAINVAGGKGGDKLTAANELKTELENVIKDLTATVEKISEVANRVDGVVESLNAAVSEEKTQPTSIDSVDKSFCDDGKLDKEYCDKLEEKLQAKGPTEVPVEEQSPVVEEMTETPVEGTAPVAEESTETLGDELTLSEEKTQPTSIDSVDKSFCDDGKLDKEYCDKLEEKLKIKEQEVVSEERESTEQVGTESEQQEDNTENNTVQQDNNEGSNSREENPTTIAVEEKKEPFVGPLPKKVHDLIEKKNSASKTLNKLENTCVLDTVGLKSELNALALETLTTDEEFAQAEEKLNSITNRINDLRGKCSDIKSKKGYIEENWQTAYNVLDKSDFNLNLVWNKLKDKTVTEDNLKDLAGEYKGIAGRVKAVIDNSNEISKLTGKISTAIEGNKDLEWFDEAYYNGQLNEISKKAKTEESLGRIIDELDLLYDELQNNYSKKEIKAVNKALDEIDNSAIVKGACTQSRWRGLKKENKLTLEQCNTLKDKFVAERDRLVKNANSNHSVVGLAEKLKNLYGKTDEYINDVAKLNADASEIEEIINEVGKFGLIDAEYFRKELAEKKTYLLENLKNQRTDMEAFLNELKTNFGMENLNTLNSLDSEINKIISDFGEYKASYVSQYKEKYAAKCEELKEMHDAGKAVAELEKYKKALQKEFDGLKKSCKNNPAKCGK